MPRQARLDVPGALHHIMVRGIDKTDIFRDDEDKSRFLERLGQNVEEGKCSVYAWVLMSNHVHILFQSGKDGISTTMRKLLTWYEQTYRKPIGSSLSPCISQFLVLLSLHAWHAPSALNTPAPCTM